MLHRSIDPWVHRAPHLQHWVGGGWERTLVELDLRIHLAVRYLRDMPHATPADVRPEVLSAFRKQVEGCRSAGSEYTARLMERCVLDLEEGGPLAVWLADWEGEPLLDALCQRVLGAVQGRALAGDASEFAATMPSLGGVPSWPATGDAFLAQVERHGADMRPRLDEQVQTNEVRRCAGLLGGFLRAAQRSGLPLRLLEIGTSAGLNLFWDRYGYKLGPHRWGPEESPLTVDCEWRGSPPDLGAAALVASRKGCDLFPLDLRDPNQLRRIESFFWADQTDRHATLHGAASALPAAGAPIERCHAVDFLARELSERQAGVATVVFHSSMWWYLSPGERADVARVVEDAGARADHDAPVYWLRAEAPNLEYVEVRLRGWPDEPERLLARAHHHGRWVSWRDETT